MVATKLISGAKYITVLFALFLIMPTYSQKHNEMIYILLWTYHEKDSWETYWHIEMGQQAFIARNCAFQNCYITPNRTFFENIVDFDVVLFNAEHIFQYITEPKSRSVNQLYIFFSSEPAALYPIKHYFNGFFNLTWTYKFSSNIFHPFFVVKNNMNEIIGPKINMHWIDYDSLAPTNDSIIEKLKTKSIAAAWVAGERHCNDRFERYVFIQELRRELYQYGHSIDIYGACGNMSCPRKPLDRAHLLNDCYDKIERDYYFYLAFENSFSDDYITEKVLHGLQHYSVPIVFGAVNYTRFLPTASYIDALKLGTEELAKEMNDIINDPPRYYDFFKWHGYYTFQDTTDNDHHESVCEFCGSLNRLKGESEPTAPIYYDITGWWNIRNLNSEQAYSVQKEPEPDDNQGIVAKVLDFLLDE